MNYSNVEVDILVNSKPIKKFGHHGNVYVQAHHQTEYSLRIRNNNATSRMVVVSVDGLNVINGQAAGSSKYDGYIVDGYNSIEVKGFRTSNSTIHPFKFAVKHRSYAAKSEETGGDTKNCGVIGVQVYDEKMMQFHYVSPIYVPSSTPYWNNMGGTFNSTLTSSSDMARGSSTVNGNYVTPQSFSTTSSPTKGGLIGASTTRSRAGGQSVNCVHHEQAPRKMSFSMGTEFSEREVEDSVTEVEFEVGKLCETITIYYGSRNDLITMGVPIMPRKAITTLPNPFPNRFCKPPIS
mgnify:CR=1 FL=1